MGRRQKALSERKKERATNNLLMENLPLEIGLEILSWLPISSIIRLKSVSKSLRSLAQNPRLRALYLAHASRRDPSILLLHSGACSQLHHLAGSSATNAVEIGSGGLDFAKLVPTGSCNGFLCISDSENSLTPVCLWNPFTGHRIQLPKPTAASFPGLQHVAVGFGPDPTTSAPKIVRVEYYNRPTPFGRVWTSQVQVLTVGAASWREIGRTLWNLKPGSLSEGVLVNSALHWLTLPSKGRVRIVSFDLKEEEFTEVVFPEELDPKGCNLTHLVALSGCLSAVVVSGGGVEVWVMREYGVKESWAREFVIDGTHLSRELNPNEGGDRGSNEWGSSAVRVLCKLVSSGAVLVQVGGCKLVTYSLETTDQELKELVVSGLPPIKLFSVILHMESM